MRDRELFRSGGPLNIRKTAKDRYAATVKFPVDEDGMQGRQCPNEECKPQYFRVMPGTGCDTGEAHCPYCAHAGGHQSFTTEAQIQYAKALVLREAEHGARALMDQMFRDAFGLRPGQRKKKLGECMSIEMSGRRPPRRHVAPPLEEKLRRDLVCPKCELKFAVFGLASWCPDCGEDVFLAGAEAEFAVVTTILGEVEERRARLGERVAARDIENALEDVVSTFEAVVRRLVLRALIERGETREGAEEKVRKLGNCFQSVARGKRVAIELLREDLFAGISAAEEAELERAFAARNPVTHNASVVDRRYLERTGSGEKEGREIKVTIAEVARSVELSLKVVQDFHGRLFQ